MISNKAIRCLVSQLARSHGQATGHFSALPALLTANPTSLSSRMMRYKPALSCSMTTSTLHANATSTNSDPESIVVSVLPAASSLPKEAQEPTSKTDLFVPSPLLSDNQDVSANTDLLLKIPSLMASFTSNNGSFRKTELIALIDSYHTMKKLQLLKELQPSQLQQIVKGLFSNLYSRDNPSIIAELWADIKNLNLQITPQFYSSLVLHISMFDTSCVSEWQFKQGRLAQEKFYAERTKSKDRNGYISSLTYDIGHLESTSLFVLGTEVFEAAISAGATLEREAYDCYIHSCALRGEAILAESAYLQMVEAGHIANIKTYASMITAHGIAEDAFKAQSWFEKYTESSEPPSITPFVAFAQSLVLGDRVPAAIDVLTRLLPSAISSVDIWPINDLMALFERRLDYDSMQLLYDTISRDSTLPQPNFKTFLYMMSASLIKGNLNESLGYYSRIESKHMSSYQIGLLGCACADAGDCDLSLSLANEQLRRSLLPESSHVAKLIDLLYKADKTGVRALSFLKRVISEFVKRKQDKFATSPTVDYGLNALVTQCEDNLRCALDVFAYAEKTRVRLSRYFATRVCSSFRKADPETISGLSTTDYAAIFDCTFAQYNRDSHLSSVGLVRASIRRLLSSMLASNLVPTVQIDEIVCRGYDTIRDSIGKAEWRVAMRPYNFEFVDNPLQRDTQKKPVFFFKEWHKPAPVIRQTIQDQESRTLLSKLEVHCAASEIKEAMEVYEQISESGKVIPFQTLQSLMRLVSKDENTNNVVHVMRTAIANAEQSKDMIIRTRAPLAAYESAIQALLTRRHTLLASKLVEEVISKFNKIPSSHICIMLFQNFNSSVSINLTDARRLDHIFTSYIKDKSLINIPLHVFECMFRVYRITKDLEKAKSLEKLMQDNKLRIGTSSYANLVAIFVENDCTANALGAFDHYLDSTPTPSMAVFNTMMKMHINHARDIKSALDIWHVSRQLNVMPDSDSLRWLLAGLTDLSKDPVSAEKLFDALTLPASHPGSTGLCLPCTSVHYDILLNGYAHMDVPDSDRMIELYDRMIAQKISPTLMTFENVISGLCRGKDASTRIAEQFRDRMATYRLVPTPAIYNSIMKLYFDLNDAAGASRVFEELARNLDPNYAPDLQSYEIMIKGLVGVGQRERAAGFLDRARRHGGYPKTRVDELEKLLLK